MDLPEPVDDPAGTASQPGVRFFEAGDWIQAIPLLQNLDDPSPAAAACLMIYHTLTAGNADELDHDLPASPDIDVCRLWSTITDEADSALLDELARTCRDATWFPIWTLVIRTLADFDQRHTLRDMVDAAGSPTTPGYQLALAEAQLECGLIATDVHTVDVEACQPLPPSAARLWQRWLIAEFDHWQGTTQPIVLDDLDPPADDPYAQQQWNFLVHKAALFNARIQPLESDQWLDIAAQHADTWENDYVMGLQAWATGNLRAAADHLDRCLQRNPAQSRVAFEMGVLRRMQSRPGMPRAVVGVPDMVACAAVAQFQAGNQHIAADLLAELDAPAVPYALRLISPQAVQQRISQGRALWAQLAEIDHDWLTAVDRWHSARAAEPDYERNLDYRAHRLYLLGRHVQQVGKTADRPHYVQFQRELGLLAVRPLMGDAMFYRSMAAADYKPDRAMADWRALLRQRNWLSDIHRAPSRLICIGDRLRQAGVVSDAAKAYMQATAYYPLTPSMLGRIAETNPAALRDMDPDTLPDEPIWDWLLLLAYLSEAPVDPAAVDVVLTNGNLPESWQIIGDALAAIALDHADAQSALETVIHYAADLPEHFRVGLETLAFPATIANLHRFQSVYGPSFQQWLPLSPESLLAARLRLVAGDPAVDTATLAHDLHQFAQLGIVIPAGWHALVLALQATDAAARGDRATATMLHQQAQHMLTQGS